MQIANSTNKTQKKVKNKSPVLYCVALPISIPIVSLQFKNPFVHMSRLTMLAPQNKAKHQH